MSVFKYLADGDSVTVKTNMDSIYSHGMQRHYIKGKYIIYEIKVIKVIPKPYPPDTALFNTHIKSYVQIRNNLLKQAEPDKIEKYINDHKLGVTTTPSGLNYVITRQGTGDKPVIGDSVEVFYVAKFLNGQIFETNNREIAQENKILKSELKYNAIRVPVGVKKVILGWDEGLLLLNKGAKATFIIPSALAYGEQGYAVIPPYTPLVFEIEVTDIIHP